MVKFNVVWFEMRHIKLFRKTVLRGRFKFRSRYKPSVEDGDI